MTTTITTLPGRHADQLIERACAAFLKDGGAGQPSSASDVHDINGSTAVILRNTNGVLAAYCVHDTALKRMSAGHAATADLFVQAFDVPRDLRSPEYKAGALAALQFRLSERKIPRPYIAGTAADDAFYAGVAEGHAIWRRAQAESTEFATASRVAP